MFVLCYISIKLSKFIGLRISPTTVVTEDTHKHLQWNNCIVCGFLFSGVENA